MPLTGISPAIRVGGGTTILFVIDGGGSAITTGIKGDVMVSFACSIQSVTLLADQTGSISVDIWRAPFASFPPTSGNSITGGSPPTISSGVDYQNTTLSGWQVALNAGDILRFNVVSATTITRVTVALGVAR